MDLRSRLRSKLQTPKNSSENGAAKSDSTAKLSLADRIRLKKQQQLEPTSGHDSGTELDVSALPSVQSASPDSSASPGLNLTSSSGLKQPVSTGLKQPVSSGHNLPDAPTLKEKFLAKKKQLGQVSPKAEVTSEFTPEQITLPPEKTDKPKPNSKRKLYDWFNLLSRELSENENRCMQKRRKNDGVSLSSANDSAALDANLKNIIDEQIYRISYPYTNMKLQAISNFSKPSPDEIILTANKLAELNQQSLKNMSLGGHAAAGGKPIAAASNMNSRAVKFVKENYAAQPHLSLCILGHIDSGKSTLTGRLLLDTKTVSQQQISILQKRSKELGKQSFWLAWLMDSDSEERERGITKKFGYARFQSEMGLQYTLLDAPGHSDFISSTIIAIQQSTVCTIVVDCSIGGFEKSFEGQLKEHLLLACKFVSNLDDLIFVMNKMDTIDWDEERYVQIKTKITNHMISELKIDENIVSKLEFIPVSSIEGDNVVRSIDSKTNPKSSWYKGLSFIEKLDEKNLEQLKVDFPEISEKYINQDNCLAIVLDNQQQSKNNSTKQKGKDCSLTVKIIDGYFTKGDKVTISPRLASKGYEIDEIWMETKEITNKTVPFAIKNQFVTLKIKNCNIDMVSIGDIISLEKEKDKVHCSHAFQLKLETFSMNRPLLPGSPIVIYMNDVEIPCMISSIKVFKEIIDGDTKTKKKLKHLTGNTSDASVKIEIQEITESIKAKELGFSQAEESSEEHIAKTEEEDELLKRVIPVFTSKENQQLSKVLIRKDGQTIAFGHIHKRLD